jgi:hypothetical protein
MTEKNREPKTLAEAMMLTTPPNFGALAENVQRLSDIELSNAVAFVRGLCGDEPVPSSTVALGKAKRTFDRYWGKHASRD